MSQPRRKAVMADPEDASLKEQSKTELPDVAHHYVAVDKEASKQAPVSVNDALGATAQSFS